MQSRIAELESLSATKGNRKVTLTVTGFVQKALMLWDDGDETNLYVVDKVNTEASLVRFTGTARLSPGWSAGYQLQVEFPRGNGFVANQTVPGDNAGGLGDVDAFAFFSNLFIKSEKWGLISVGQQDHPTERPAPLFDLSGTVLQSNPIVFEGPFFNLRPSGKTGVEGLESAGAFGSGVWGQFLTCNVSSFGSGFDCNGLPNQSIRYETPTWNGFGAFAAWGEDDIWDVAVGYNRTGKTWAVSAAGFYTEARDERFVLGGGGNTGFEQDVSYLRSGASLLHVPSGLFAYGTTGREMSDRQFAPAPVTGRSELPASDAWYVKAGIKRGWSPLGATVLYGEYAEYGDMIGGFLGPGPFLDVCANGLGTVPGTPLATACAAAPIEVTGSTVQRFGLGAVQEIDAAALRLYVRWQRLELDADFLAAEGPVRQSYEPLDIVMTGGTIFF